MEDFDYSDDSLVFMRKLCYNHKKITRILENLKKTKVQSKGYYKIEHKISTANRNKTIIQPAPFMPIFFLKPYYTTAFSQLKPIIVEIKISFDEIFFLPLTLLWDLKVLWSFFFLFILPQL